MESRVDYASRPDFGAHVGRLGEAELRRLLRVACPGVPVPGSRTETAELLMTREAAQTAVSAATPDVLAAVKLVHVLEDSAAVDDIAAVAVWGSEADAMPHDGDQPPSSVRAPATRADVAGLMGRAEDLGLAWQEPKGVWNVPPHVSEILVQDPTMATPVECLLEFNSRAELLRKMENLGLVDAAEFDRESVAGRVADQLDGTVLRSKGPGVPSDAELLARLREFLCSPRRVRALVATAPHAIQKSLLLFAREGIFLDAREWGDRRADAVEWAVEHLLAVTFEMPTAIDGGGNPEIPDSAGAPDAAGAAEVPASVDPAESSGAADAPGIAETDEASRAAETPEVDLNASLISPVALALKLGRLYLPTPHPEEPRPAWAVPEAQVDAATSAVAVATAIMQRWEDGGYLGAGGLHEFTGAVAVHDFAASIGADDAVVHEVVGMLAAAGFMHPVSGQPTARSAQKWFSADASRRWAWLVAGWLRGPDRWVADEAPESWMPAPELMADVAKRVRREAVMFAARLDEGMMWYPCCIESHLGWTCGALFEGLEDMWGMLLHRVMQGMRVLGLLVDGAAGMPVRAVAAAMGHAWLSGQDPLVDEAVDMIAGETGDFVPVTRRAQLVTPPNVLVADRVELVAMVRGVPGHDLAVTLDSVAHREKCGTTSLWVFTEESLAAALEDYEGDVAAILEAVGHATAAGPWLRILRHRLRAVEESAGMELLLPDDPADEWFGPDVADDADDEAPPHGPVREDAAEEAALFDVVGVDDVVVGENGVVEPPLFDIPGVRPSASLLGESADGEDGVDRDGDGGVRGGGAGHGEGDGDAGAGARDGADRLGDAAGAARAGDEAGENGDVTDGFGGSGSADASYIEDPLRRPDSGSGPGVPTQPPLF
ncbi:hypothetical protein ACFORJ_06705 [Corynebacterium hansenii]|uniref:Helicase XPB/Ssl2 N-terminal domain-containing protein n=1 Tax=Corynebacterium hansenii TaxID=394964 RepID=A0ABV7ZRV6_9CORY|nr:hypothetical protein [Corynebacterium hansenii]